MNKTINIAGRAIGPGHAPYIVAELSANHNGELERALKIIAAASEAGAHAVKLQTYTPDTLTIDHDSDDFQLRDGLWSGQTLYQLYEQAHMPWEWHQPLFEHARKLGITVFSSPFDTTAVDLLEELDAPAYKIASFEIVDLPLIAYTAATGKPLIISTGMANAGEIQLAVDTARLAGCKELLLLHCVSAYPAEPGDYNLRTLQDMHARFGVPTGLSDHTIGNTTALTAIALGACMIEKHFTLDRAGGGPDDSFSMEPHELAALVESSATAAAALGATNYARVGGEQDNIRFRRSLYFVRDKQAGEVIQADDVRCIRPGFGLAPRYLQQVIGATLVRPASYGTPVTWEHLPDQKPA